MEIGKNIVSVQNAQNISITNEIIQRERRIGKLFLLVNLIKEENKSFFSSISQCDLVKWSGFSKEEIAELCLLCGEFCEPDKYILVEIWRKTNICEDRLCVLTWKIVYQYGNFIINYFIKAIKEEKITENNCLEYLKEFENDYLENFENIIKIVNDIFDIEDSTCKYKDINTCINCLILYGIVIIEKIDRMIKNEYPFEIIFQITSFDFSEKTYDKFKKIMNIIEHKIILK